MKLQLDWSLACWRQWMSCCMLVGWFQETKWMSVDAHVWLISWCLAHVWGYENETCISKSLKRAERQLGSSAPCLWNTASETLSLRFLSNFWPRSRPFPQRPSWIVGNRNWTLLVWRAVVKFAVSQREGLQCCLGDGGAFCPVVCLHRHARSFALQPWIIL